MMVSDQIEEVLRCEGFLFLKYGEMKMKNIEVYNFVENLAANVVVTFNF